MAIDTTNPKTRRAILISALGGVTASVAAAVGRASPVDAANGDIIKVGRTYSATNETTINATGHLVGALVGTSTSGSGVNGSSDAGIGVWGSSNDSGTGVYGNSISGYGVLGSSDSGYGVYGQGVSSSAIWGAGHGSDQPAIVGQSLAHNTGVQGHSGFEVPPAAPLKTGVYGYANQDANAVGVKGQSVLGTGGLFTAGANGTSLRATGRVKFDKAAGVATIAAATNSITVAPGTDLTATSAVVATLQGIPNGTAMVKSVAVSPTANTFTIYLTANATHATKVAWHVFG